MNIVLRLPSDARSSLRVDPLSLIGFTDERHAGNHNQDRLAVAYSAGQGVSAGWLLALVCDGVGGSSHGERAASLAVASTALEVAVSRPESSAVDTLRKALQLAHGHTAAAFHSKSSTTAVALLVRGDSAAIGWVGDSRAYQISDGKLTLVTSDDTLAGAMARTDSEFKFELNEEYADRLSQAIGGANPVNANAISWKPMTPDASCLLCTDGVWKPTEAVLGTVVDVCREGQELMRRLLLISDWMGGTDNASAILVPPLRAVREFISDPANATPRDSVMICLPGNFQTLIPLQSLKGTAVSVFPKHRDDRSTDEDVSAPEPKKASTKRRSDSGKTRSKRSPAHSGSQLVIAEEPLDEAETTPTSTLHSDEAPT